jgi:opacity protein-like surface antigen
MNRFFALLFSIVLAAGAVSARAQVVNSASRRQFTITAGALGSVFQPDYAGAGVAQTSPNRLYGVGAFADFKFNRWIQLEGEARWLRYNEYLGIDETTYLGGPRLPLHMRRFGHATPYVKVLFGIAEGSFLNGQASDLVYGGGIDYRLTRKITVRAVDYEYQQWKVNGSLNPYGLSAGVAYKVF